MLLLPRVSPIPWFVSKKSSSKPETPSQLARSWANALTGFNVREYDDEEIARAFS